MSQPPGPELLVVRHGETEWSKNGRHTGRTDVVLTEAGEAQARALARHLDGRRPVLVLTSPLIRAAMTARLAGMKAAVVDPDLMEWDYGDYEGKTTAEIQRDVPGWSIWTGTCPNGETIAQVAARADRVVARARAEAGPGQTAIAFGHGHILRVVAARWLGAPPDTGRWLALATGSLSELGWERATEVIQRWNLSEGV